MASSTMSSQARLDDEELPVQRLTKADLSAVMKVFLTGAVVVVVVLVVVVLVVVVGGLVVVVARVVAVGGAGIPLSTVVDHGPTTLAWLMARTSNEYVVFGSSPTTSQELTFVNVSRIGSRFLGAGVTRIS